MPDLPQQNVSIIKNERLSSGDLISITEEHPYYSVAQWQLLLKYKNDQHQNFGKQATVASLFFNNQKWLNWQLSHQPGPGEKGDRFDLVLPGGDSDRAPAITQNTVSDTGDIIAFEPLHTVDYFASLGIKISEEALSFDKLGTQLKSFTEWLKSMKKIHSGKLPEGDEQTDKIIQNIAEGSNATINVVTEAMAEVLLKQGKAEQAIDIYNKLSLNYPSRSAYFTAKIKNLKSV